MKNILFLILFCIVFIANVANAITTTEYVDALEKTLFGTTYQNQSLEKRIDRIEIQIYDKSYSGSNENRLEKIDKIYPRNEFEIGSNITEDNIYNNVSSKSSYEEQYQDDTETYDENVNSSDYNDYPIVSEIEEKIYQKNYKGEDIYKRLARLEKELYGSVKNEQSLQERVETLKSVLPKKFSKNQIANDFSFKQPINFNNNSNAYFDSLSKIEEIEVQTFGRTFGNDDISKRIERLEQFYFGDAFIGKTPDDRVTRLASIARSNLNSTYNSKAAAQWAGILVNLLMIGLGFLL